MFKSPESINMFPYMTKRTLQMRLRLEVFIYGDYPGSFQWAQYLQNKQL